MAERQLPKLHTRVRFPSPAPSRRLRFDKEKPLWLSGNNIAVLLISFAAAWGSFLFFTSQAKAEQNPLAWLERFFSIGPAPAPPQQVSKPKPHKIIARPRLLRPHASLASVEKSKIASSLFIAVFGDGLAQMLGQALPEVLSDRPDIAILRKTQDNSGLVRIAVADWDKMIRDYLASTRIDMAIMMTGSNDSQPLTVEGKTYDLLSPQWKEIYGQRIEAIAKQFADKKIPLLWVGLPVMKSDEVMAEATAFNAFFNEHASKLGAQYLDIWESFADEHGLYSAYGPNVEGETVRLRRADGVYFTAAGARKLAHFVAREIRQRFEKTAPEEKPEFVHLPSDGGKPLMPELAPEPEPVKPDIGQVLPLTNYGFAASSELAAPAAAENPRRKNSADQDLIERTLQQGEAPDPKKGRADDFSWP